MAKNKQTAARMATAAPASLDASREPSAGPEAALILLIGVAAALAGLCLSAGPQLSAKFGDLSSQFARLGVYGGTLCMSGLVLVVLGLLRRGQQQIELELWRTDNDPVQEQLAQDALDTREVVGTVELEVTNLVRVVKELQAGMHALVQRTGDSREPDALLSVASHVQGIADQLDQKLQLQATQATQLQEQLTALRSDFSAAVENLERSSLAAIEIARAQADRSAEVTTAHTPGSALHVDPYAAPSEEPAFDPVAFEAAPARTFDTSSSRGQSFASVLDANEVFAGSGRQTCASPSAHRLPNHPPVMEGPVTSPAPEHLPLADTFAPHLDVPGLAPHSEDALSFLDTQESTPREAAAEDGFTVVDFEEPIPPLPGTRTDQHADLGRDDSTLSDQSLRDALKRLSLDAD